MGSGRKLLGLFYFLHNLTYILISGIIYVSSFFTPDIAREATMPSKKKLKLVFCKCGKIPKLVSGFTTTCPNGTGYRVACSNCGDKGMPYQATPFKANQLWEREFSHKDPMPENP